MTKTRGEESWESPIVSAKKNKTFSTNKYHIHGFKRWILLGGNPDFYRNFEIANAFCILTLTNYTTISLTQFLTK